MTTQAAQLPAVYRPLRRALLAGLGLSVIGTMATVMVATDLGLQLIQMTARGVAKAGFDINEVKVSGTVNASRLEITAAVLNGSTNSMLFADLDDIRERIEQNRWVQSATVVRKLPGRIDIRIVERKPAALWQSGGQFAVIDSAGVVLSTRSVEQFARLPRIVGADAAVHVPALFTLLASEPEVTRGVEAAVWVGSRRWDLLFRTGERLKLPEGAAATPALARFAQLNRQTPLFGRGFGQFDLRVTDRLVATPAAALANQKAPLAEPPVAGQPVAPSAPSQSLPAVPPASVREIRI
jgi:cell division protein FtsQ